jgi:hypothetical protein
LIGVVRGESIRVTTVKCDIRFRDEALRIDRADVRLRGRRVT